MMARFALTSLFAVLWLTIQQMPAGDSVGAKVGSKAIAQPTEAKRDGMARELDAKQRALIEKVNTYFNQVTNLRGEFVQTSASGSRLRGKFYVRRPGCFRFDYARPSRLVIVSDGRYVAIQDHDLGTDDRWELDQTPFAVLLRQHVNLLRDVRFSEVYDSEDAIVLAFEGNGQRQPGTLKLFFAKRPTLELKKWITKDLQGLDTVVELTSIARVDGFEADLFNPAAVTVEKR